MSHGASEAACWRPDAPCAVCWGVLCWPAAARKHGEFKQGLRQEEGSGGHIAQHETGPRIQCLPAPVPLLQHGVLTALPSNWEQDSGSAHQHGQVADVGRARQEVKALLEAHVALLLLLPPPLHLHQQLGPHVVFASGLIIAQACLSAKHKNQHNVQVQEKESPLPITSSSSFSSLIKRA